MKEETVGERVAYKLEGMLVVDGASSALFDLRESDAVFREYGEVKYREYQEAKLDEVLQPGVAFSSSNVFSR